MPVVLGLTYLFNIFDLRLGLDNGAGLSSGLGLSYVMMGANCPFGQGTFYLKMGELCVTFFVCFACYADALEHCSVKIKLLLDQGSTVLSRGGGGVVVFAANAYSSNHPRICSCIWWNGRGRGGWWKVSVHRDE